LSDCRNYKSSSQSEEPKLLLFTRYLYLLTERRALNIGDLFAYYVNVTSVTKYSK